MTTLHQHLEEMRVRLAENSTSELAMVHALADALRRIDEKLLREVRTVTADHEQRRTAILGEMLTLATRLCALPDHHQPPPRPASIEQHAHIVAADPLTMSGMPGDWRQAAKNIEDDLEYPFSGHLPTH